ncbi:metallophosphoesterase family protein [Bacillus sp. T3]|uniref:metallophosphoesterase family protein n=1 Tax=Bacillus sp. T3 TaxID=467262 RepID=UPI0029825104|nr:metallophosphoesterase family protein [Bacillus sp. T3]
MKIAFISDIHGNAVALDAVLRELKRSEVDKIYVLGDVCYRGPEPKRSLELVRSLDTEVIKGNADEWVVRGVREGEVPPQALNMMQTERDWTVSQLDETDLDYLRGLPSDLKINLNNVAIHGFHATPESLFEIVLPDSGDDVLETRLMQGAQDAQIYVYGHIHRPYIRFINGKIVMNIGSVGLPFDGMAKASYGLVEVEDGRAKVSIQRVDYDLEKVIELYENLDYPNTAMMTEVIRNGRL